MASSPMAPAPPRRREPACERKLQWLRAETRSIQRFIEGIHPYTPSSKGFILTKLPAVLLLHTLPVLLPQFPLPFAGTMRMAVAHSVQLAHSHMIQLSLGSLGLPWFLALQARLALVTHRRPTHVVSSILWPLLLHQPHS